jgi:hypothetical protein
LLSGDRTLLEQHYRLASSGTRPRWMLTLTPRDAQFAARVRDIVLYGRGAELRCIETTPTTQGEVQRTLLAGAARDAAGVDSSAGLAKLCHGESASR